MELATLTIAEEINRLYAQALSHRDRAVEHAFTAVESAVECGRKLIEAKTLCHGEFDFWLTTNCPQISRRTAYNYIAVARKVQTFAQSPTDFQTLKQLYIACGIMPEPEMHEHGVSKTVSGWLQWTPKIDALIPRLSKEEKADLRRWCEATLERL